MIDLSQIESLDEFVEQVASLSDAELEHLRREVALPPRPIDVLAVLDREIAARRAEAQALPTLLARLDTIGRRLRQPGRIPRRRYRPESPDTSEPASATQQRGLPAQALWWAQRAILGRWRNMIEVIAMLDQRTREREQVTLTDQISYIDKRLSEIEAITASLNDGSYRKSELLDEARALTGTRNASAHRLRVLDNNDDEDECKLREDNQRRVEKLRQARAAAYRKRCEQEALECERQGDHRNAKLHRLEALRCHAVAEWEIR